MRPERERYGIIDTLGADRIYARVGDMITDYGAWQTADAGSADPDDT